MKMQAAQMLLDGSEEAPAEASRGFAQFMELSSREKGLLLPAQAAIVLGVSNQRVLQLVQAGKFQAWEFFGKSYVSAREIEERRASDVKSGRPPRRLGQRIKNTGKVLASMDGPQIVAALLD
jgi:hypothetical protein